MPRLEGEGHNDETVRGRKGEGKGVKGTTTNIGIHAQLALAHDACKTEKQKTAVSRMQYRYTQHMFL